MGPKGASPWGRPVRGEATPHLPGALPWAAGPWHTPHPAPVSDISLSSSPRAADGVKLKLVNTTASCSIVNSHNFSSVVGTMAVVAGQALQPSPARAPLLTPMGGRPQHRPCTVGFPHPGASRPYAWHQPHQRPRGEAPSNFLALKRFLRDLDKTRASCFLMCFTKGILCQKSASS